MISYVEAMIKISEDFMHVTYDAFMIFGLRLLFKEFKNSSRSCFVNKMSEILGPFLDTASHYTQ